jgi:hypothetical protein
MPDNVTGSVFVLKAQRKSLKRAGADNQTKNCAPWNLPRWIRGGGWGRPRLLPPPCFFAVSEGEKAFLAWRLPNQLPKKCGVKDKTCEAEPTRGCHVVSVNMNQKPAAAAKLGAAWDQNDNAHV